MPELSPTARKALTWLKGVKTRHDAEARVSKRRSSKGWTYRQRQFRAATFVALFRKGLIESCCRGHEGRDAVRISPAGEAALASLDKRRRA